MKKRLTAAVLGILLLSGCMEDPNYIYMDQDFIDRYQQYAVPTATPEPTAAPIEQDFMDLKWGMSQEEVTAIEGEDYIEANGILKYQNLNVSGYPAEAEYTMKNGRLVQCVYYTTHYESDAQVYIDSFLLLKEKYIKKYGQPDYDTEKWADDARSIPPAQALAAGTMMYRTGWKYENTEMNLVLFRDDDGRVKIGIRYQPIRENVSSEVAPGGR